MSDASAEIEWIETQLPSGRRVLVRGMPEEEAGDGDAGQLRDVGFRGLDFEALTTTLQEVGALVKGAVHTLTPAEAEVQLGLGISAKTGQILLLFGDAAADASIKVTLKWRFDQRSDSADEA